jgi:hypothetical protein
MAALTLQNALLTNEQLADSPSRRDGISEETERTLLDFGCELIQSAGILLKLFVAFHTLCSKCLKVVVY